MKLVAIDLDGTLLNKEGNVSEENAAALKEFDRQGGTVALATGRSMDTHWPQTVPMSHESKKAK